MLDQHDFKLISLRCQINFLEEYLWEAGPEWDITTAKIEVIEKQLKEEQNNAPTRKKVPKESFRLGGILVH